MTLLVGENWSGSGFVNNKTPSSGGGTWIATFNTNMAYASGFAGPNATFNVSPAYHSATYTDAKFNAAVYPVAVGGSSLPAIIYARADVNNDPYPNCYYVTCKDGSETFVSLSKRVGGVETELFNVAANPFGQTVSLEVNAAAIKVYLAGSLIIDATDSSITSGGYWGFGVQYTENGEDTGESTVGAITIETTAPPPTPVLLQTLIEIRSFTERRF